jgi:formylglycine-generating enzyme required for sulfatase activity
VLVFTGASVPALCLLVLWQGEGNPSAVSPSGGSPRQVVSPREDVKRGDWKPSAASPREVVNSIGMKFVLIPPGTFEMGSPEDDKERSSEEEQHEVEITRPFYLGVYAVTQKQFKEVMGYHSSHFSTDGTCKPGNSYDSVPAGGNVKVKALNSTDDLPVENVSWEEARAFNKKLAERPEERKSGRKYRLPSEAEWEYACRGGATSYRVFHWGNSGSSTLANFDRKLGRTCAVGSYPPNAFGLFDMHGNVWQWCQDWYGKHYYGDSPRKDPPGPGAGSERVIRGGFWDSPTRDCRSANRFRFLPDRRNCTVGFRAVLVLPAE